MRQNLHSDTYNLHHFKRQPGHLSLIRSYGFPTPPHDGCGKLIVSSTLPTFIVKIANLQLYSAFNLNIHQR